MDASFQVDDSIQLTGGSHGSITFSTGGPAVTFHPDGTVTFDPAYTPDDAARLFWDAAAQYNPLRAVVQAQHQEIERLRAALESR